MTTTPEKRTTVSREAVTSEAALRPWAVTAAGLVLVVIGTVLGAGASSLIVAGLVTADEPGGGIFVLAGILLLPFCIPHLIAGRWILRLSSSGWSLGVALCVMVVLLSLMMVSSGELEVVLLGIGLLVIHIVVLIVLVKDARLFR